MKKIHIIGLIVIAVSISILFTALGSSGSYATLNEAIKNPNTKYTVSGQWMKEKGMVYEPLKDANRFSFYLKDSVGTVMNVVYHNSKPTDFERAEKIVVKGMVQGDHFEASDILMKCPSKYNAETPVVKE